MAIKDSYPAIRPSLDLNFAGSRMVDPRITFTRASTATYFDEKGVMRTAPAGVPRIDHDPVTVDCKGLLIEEQRTNLLKYSAQFDNAAWAKTESTITANTIVAPDGTLTGYKIVANSGVSVGPTTVSVFASQEASKAATATTYSVSLYAKAAEFNAVRIFARDTATSANNATATISLLDGSTISAAAASGAFTSASALAALVGNGWYMVVLTFTSSTETSIRMVFSVNNSSILTGDGTSGIYIWGAQLEAGSFPTSYIKTETSQVTRAADGSSITGVDFTKLFNPNEGTVVVEADYFGPNLVDSTTTGIVSLSDGATNFFSIIARTDINSVRAAISAGITILSTSNNYPENTSKKIALAYKNNDFGLCLGGATVYTDNTNQVNTNINSLIIGAYYATASRKLNGHIKRIAMYNRRVANANLQALTA